jgi:hypothetical protein
MNEILSKIGLNDNEKKDFMECWGKRIKMAK